MRRYDILFVTYLDSASFLALISRTAFVHSATLRIASSGMSSVDCLRLFFRDRKLIVQVLQISEQCFEKVRLQLFAGKIVRARATLNINSINKDNSKW